MIAPRTLMVETINHEHILISITDDHSILIIPADDYFTAELSRDDALKLFGLLALWVSEYAQQGPEQMAWLVQAMERAKAEHEAAELRTRKAGEA